MTIVINKLDKADLLDHEKLTVYQVAIEFVILADEVIKHLPRGRAYLSDQLQRAALSITLNIAEGAGEYAVDEKVRFYRMAKRSATECAGVLEVCQRLGLLEESRYMAGRELLLKCSINANKDGPETAIIGQGQE